MFRAKDFKFTQVKNDLISKGNENASVVGTSCTALYDMLIYAHVF